MIISYLILFSPILFFIGHILLELHQTYYPDYDWYDQDGSK